MYLSGVLQKFLDLRQTDFERDGENTDANEDDMQEEFPINEDAMTDGDNNFKEDLGEEMKSEDYVAWAF